MNTSTKSGIGIGGLLAVVLIVFVVVAINSIY
jgi:hypothetical protein